MTPQRWRRDIRTAARAMLDKKWEGAAMADQRQVNSIIATAICDARKEDPVHRMDPEEAKQIAKCIVEALTDAGLQIVPITKE